ncbi:MAG: glycosyltransferase family 4 protein [Phycisphaerales bacterium]|nr:glycosyltransferase family 4 protein [Phycisphaerales bacterium]
MKILHIITRLIVGGAQENTLLTCEGLHKRGHEVILLTGPSIGAEGSLMQRAEAGGYKVMLTPHLVRSPHPWHDWRAYRKIENICRELKPDVVHTHSSKAGIVGRAAAWRVRGKNSKLETRNLKLSVVHTIHGLPFHPYQNAAANRLWISLERWAAKRCDAIICVADAMTRQALAAGVGRADMYTTIYSGMEAQTFVSPGTTREQIRTKYGIPPTAFVFGTIARLQPLKGHDDLLTTANELFARVPDAHLMWIGDGIFRQRFEKMLAEKGWSDRVTMTGLVPPTEVPRLLPATDALVHPSYREGLARALPQGLLAGVPVISYDCDGAGEVCLDGQTGFLVKTGDAQGLCEAMVKMASNRAAAKAMGAFGRNYCMERFPAEVMVRRIEELYHRI